MFSRFKKPSGITTCPYQSPCVASQQDDDALVTAVAQRAKRLTGQELVTSGKQPYDESPMMVSADSSPCTKLAYTIAPTVRRFSRYSEALPGARAASDLNRLGDGPDDGKARDCLTMLPQSAKQLNATLGLPPGTITDADLRNDSTGFRAALYRSDRDGRIILVARDTQPHSLVDWQTNIDNGRGLDTDQYKAMRNLSGILTKKGVPFDVAGYSKGGGLAQEAGLMSPNSKVYVFNSAGLPEQSVVRTGAKSFESLQSRTSAFSSEGDFLTFMNTTTDHAGQLENARYLRRELEGDRTFHADPIEIQYRNPATKDAEDPAFAADRQAFLGRLDTMISDAEQNPGGKSIFPPVRAGSFDTIPNSMTRVGKTLGATDPHPNLGKLYQHKMDNVLGPMEAQVTADRDAMREFLRKCP